MIAIPQFATLPVSFDPYIRAGWHLVPIPNGTKGPRNSGWNKKENTVTDPNMIPAGYGVGLAHAYSGTMALDIDNYSEASIQLAAHGVNLQSLFDAPDAVTINSGKQGHGKLLYAMPFGLALPSKKITVPVNGVNQVTYELRCASINGLTVQDVLPPSIHPETLQPYSWGGKGHWQRLPMIPDALMSLWQSMLDHDNKRTIRTEDADTSWDDIRSALGHISPDCSREEWVTVGMALHSTEHADALATWDEWSSQSPTKYKGPNDINACWRSFKPDPDGIKIGSLFKIAAKVGWKRPMQDVQHLFSPITPENPDQVIDLMTLRLQPPDVDLNLFPELLARRANEVGVTRGCDPIVPLMAGIGAVCAAVDARCRLELLPGYQVPPILWLMTIGDPSDKKSPGAKPMLSVLQRMELEDIDRFKAEHLMWQAREAAYMAAKKNLFDHMSSADAAIENTVMPGVPILPDEPKNTRLVINDATSQKLVHLAQGRPRGFLLHLDEMGNWVNRVNDPRSGDDRGCWIAGYEGNPYTMDRVTAGTIAAENLALSIYGNIQPKIFNQQVMKMSSDGLLQRFIPITIRGDKTRKGKTIPDFMTCEAEYEQLIRKLYAMPGRTYNLSPGALEVFDQFQDWYLALRDNERLLKTNAVYMTALGKIEGTCGRLALVFHLVNNPYEQFVTTDTMQAAVEVTKRLIVPSLRYAFANEENALEQWIIDHIVHLAGEHSTITLSNLRRSAKRQIPEGSNQQQVDNDLRVVMDQLAAANWLSLMDDKRNSTVWAINPHVATLYTDYRKRVIKAKQDVKDLMINTVERSGRVYSRSRHVLGYVPEEN